jgi:hypothetical protein
MKKYQAVIDKSFPAEEQELWLVMDCINNFICDTFPTHVNGLQFTNIVETYVTFAANAVLICLLTTSNGLNGFTRTPVPLILIFPSQTQRTYIASCLTRRANATGQKHLVLTISATSQNTQIRLWKTGTRIIINLLNESNYN